MRERLDCALLCFDEPGGGMPCDEGVFARGRLVLHRVHQPVTSDDDVHVLVELASRLQRFDACMVAVSETNLAWVRQVLLAAFGRLRTPVIGLVANLTAPALCDLYNLGMADFVRAPLCPEELRIRIERALQPAGSWPNCGYTNTEPSPAAGVSDGTLSYVRAVPPARPANGSVTRRAWSGSQPCDADALRAEFLALLGEAALVASKLCVVSDESFASYKTSVIDHAVPAFLQGCLAKSSGNIALASRIAKKHRRAFWGLMRKHEIDAEPYRHGLSTSHYRRAG